MRSRFHRRDRRSCGCRCRGTSTDGSGDDVRHPRAPRHRLVWSMRRPGYRCRRRACCWYRAGARMSPGRPGIRVGSMAVVRRPTMLASLCDNGAGGLTANSADCGLMPANRRPTTSVPAALKSTADVSGSAGLLANAGAYCAPASRQGQNDVRAAETIGNRSHLMPRMLSRQARRRRSRVRHVSRSPGGVATPAATIASTGTTFRIQAGAGRRAAQR